jgi:hypothetical protein
VGELPLLLAGVYRSADLRRIDRNLRLSRKYLLRSGCCWRRLSDVFVKIFLGGCFSLEWEWEGRRSVKLLYTLGQNKFARSNAPTLPTACQQHSGFHPKWRSLRESRDRVK